MGATGSGTATRWTGGYSGGSQRARRRATGGVTTADARRTTKRSPRRAAPVGLTLSRLFSRPGVHPFDEVEWELRSATITNERGELIFEQRDCEIPKSWSQLATNVVVSKYFRGHLGTPERESSVKQLIGRVVGRIHEWGVRGGYFRDAGGRRDLPGRSSPICWSRRRWRSTARSGSTSASRERRSRRAPASSTPSPTRWSRSWASRAPRRCCSRAARAPARTCRGSARRARSSPAAARPPARSPSCAASTPSPAW